MDDQWLIYGMFACLFSCDDERMLAASMAVEADGEECMEEFEEGEMEMYQWLTDEAKRQHQIHKRRWPHVHFGGSYRYPPLFH